MVLTERDKQIIKYLKVCKVLSVEQIGRKFFPGKSLDAVRKRLRKLSLMRFLKSIRMSASPSLLYAMSPTGCPKQVEHCLTINWIRILSEEEGVDFFFSYWELGEWNYPVIPDCVMKKNGQLYLVEVDTGSESTKQLRDKFQKYAYFDFPFTLFVVCLLDSSKSIKKLAEEIIGQNVIVTSLETLLSEP